MLLAVIWHGSARDSCSIISQIKPFIALDTKSGTADLLKPARCCREPGEQDIQVHCAHPSALAALCEEPVIRWAPS
jgi:hypothetical protein